MDRDHALFVFGALLSLGHLLDELLAIRFPVDELYRLFFFVGLTAAGLVVYPRLRVWKGPVLLGFGIGWAVAGFGHHVYDLLRGQGSTGDFSGIGQFLAGLLLLAQGFVLVRGVVAARIGIGRTS